MKLAYYIKKNRLKGDARVESLLERLRAAGHVLYAVEQPDAFQSETDVLLSLGGDGTFLTAAQFAVPAGIPVLGVNFGRLGFLSENDPDRVVEALSAGDYSVEERELLQAEGLPSGANAEVAICLLMCASDAAASGDRDLATMLTVKARDLVGEPAAMALLALIREGDKELASEKGGAHAG